MLLLHNPNSTEDEASSEVSNLIKCIVAKNRSGSTGAFNLAWRGEYTKFMDVDTRQ